jgi:diadenosine tetraphosphatase ApaH/serine/threonine PP2A family protein phosphatase
VRVAVISDIHGNLHALEAVLAAVADARPDATWCLGDLVGYGPRPNECTTTVARSASICLVGNHDLGVLGRLDLADFTPDAVVAALWTREVLEDEAREYLSRRPASTSAHGCELFHGSPRDPVWEYVLSEEAAGAALRLTSSPVVLVGHSHVALTFAPEDGRVAGNLAPDGTEIDLSTGRWLLNPGSVGQPRDGDPRAAYALLDLEESRASFHRVAYPVERTQEEIRERGLPDSLAERLAVGM